MQLTPLHMGIPLHPLERAALVRGAKNVDLDRVTTPGFTPHVHSSVARPSHLIHQPHSSHTTLQMGCHLQPRQNPHPVPGAFDVANTNVGVDRSVGHLFNKAALSTQLSIRLHLQMVVPTPPRHHHRQRHLLNHRRAQPLNAVALVLGSIQFTLKTGTA